MVLPPIRRAHGNVWPGARANSATWRMGYNAVRTIRSGGARVRVSTSFVLCLLFVVRSVGGHSESAAGQSSPARQVQGANAAFEKMKTLVGEWELTLPTGARMVNTFHVIGTGSAVLQVESRPDREDVVTVFYPVGAELRADHYCFLKNQPRFAASPGPDPNVISFEMRDITNLDSSPGGRHMHATTWRFIDASHLTQEWHLYENGREARVTRLEFTRAK